MTGVDKEEEDGDTVLVSHGDAEVVVDGFDDGELAGDADGVGGGRWPRPHNGRPLRRRQGGVELAGSRVSMVFM